MNSLNLFKRNLIKIQGVYKTLISKIIIAQSAKIRLEWNREVDVYKEKISCYFQKYFYQSIFGTTVQISSPSL